MIQWYPSPTHTGAAIIVAVVRSKLVLMFLWPKTHNNNKEAFSINMIFNIWLCFVSYNIEAKAMSSVPVLVLCSSSSSSGLGYGLSCSSFLFGIYIKGYVYILFIFFFVCFRWMLLNVGSFCRMSFPLLWTSILCFYIFLEYTSFLNPFARGGIRRDEGLERITGKTSKHRNVPQTK